MNTVLQLLVVLCGACASNMNVECAWAHAIVAPRRSPGVKFHLCLHPAGDMLSPAMFASQGCHEHELVSWMLTMLRRHHRAALVDIGAHVGTFTMAAAAAGYPVHAYEPAPHSAMRLRTSLRANGFEDHVVVFEACLGEQQGWAEVGINASNQGSLRHRPLPRLGVVEGSRASNGSAAAAHLYLRRRLLRPILRLDDQPRFPAAVAQKLFIKVRPASVVL